MVPKRNYWYLPLLRCFRAVLFRMVPKLTTVEQANEESFRAVLFRMVLKLTIPEWLNELGFKAVLFRMVPKQLKQIIF